MLSQTIRRQLVAFLAVIVVALIGYLTGLPPFDWTSMFTAMVGFGASQLQYSYRRHMMEKTGEDPYANKPLP